MKTLILILFITFLCVPRADGQSFAKLHELKGITNENGTVHLFYREFIQHDSNSDYNHIYKFDTNTNTEELFLQDFFEDYPITGSISIRILDYSFFHNDVEKYIYASRADGETDFIYKYDDGYVFNGFLKFLDQILTTGDESSPVYASFLNEYDPIISFDGGQTWPDSEDLREGQVPDSLILNFPIISLSPADDSLMFGVQDSEFLRSQDAGETYELISTEFKPLDGKIYYDTEGSQIYTIDAAGCPSDCSYRIYRSTNRGESDSWEIIYESDTNLYISLNKSESGQIFIADGKQVYYSEDFGEIFHLFLNHSEPITGIYKATSSESFYFISDHGLYLEENGEITLLREVSVSVERNHEFPIQITLHQNYPNPFNPVTVISYQLPVNSDVTLEVYDMLGRRVALLVDDVMAAGLHEVTFDASNLASGVYLYRLTAGQEVQTRQMVLVK